MVSIVTMAEAFQALDAMTGQTLRFETVEKIAAQLGVARPDLIM